MDRPDAEIVPMGDRAWLIRLPGEDDARRWAAAARCAGLPGVSDVVLARRTVGIYAAPGNSDPDAIEARLRDLVPMDGEQAAGRLVEVPVLYDGADLEAVAGAVGMGRAEVVALHAGVVYDVVAVGFQPGFPYLSGVPSPLDRLPRRAEPRVRVPAGSVAIAAGQGGIYPAELPGGWNLLGTTPLSIVDPEADRFPIRAGDRIRFVPIGADEFAARRGEPLR